MQEEIENGCHQLETLLVDSADKTFDKFEIYTLRNILTVEEGLSPWMRLGHYEVRFFDLITHPAASDLLRPSRSMKSRDGKRYLKLTPVQNLQLPPPPNAPTPESILLLRRKLQETRRLNSALRRQHTSNATLITQLQILVSPSSDPSASNLSFLTSDPSATPLGLSFTQNNANSTPLTTRAGFATSQLPALRAQLEALRPKLQSLQGVVEGVDWEGKREERRAYIEGRVRKVVGKTGGESRGRIGREEVDGMEGIVGGALR